MKISINKSYINIINLLFTGIGLIVLGIVILYGKTNFLSIIVWSISLIFILNGIFQFISLTINKNKDMTKKITLGSSIFNIALGFGVIYFKNISFSIVVILFSVYAILNSIIKGIIYYIYLKNKVKGRIAVLFECIIYFAFGITALFSPLMHLNTILTIIGVYCFLLGLNFIKDFTNEIIPENTKHKLKRKVRITLPVFLLALIPHKVLTKINEYLQDEDKVEYEDVVIDEKNCSSEEVDMEVFIHVTLDGIGAVGHVDLCYNGQVISYGNYDDRSFKLFGIAGKGILFIADREKYLNFCTSYSRKTIFGYGIKLDEHQKQGIKEKLNEIKYTLIKWEPPIVKDMKENNLQHEYKDYASILYKSTEAEFFTFKSGKFKTYFGLNTNCVLLADSVLGRLGTDILGIGGIITPGTYYNYLQREFTKRNSIVISRNIYLLPKKEMA
ncbi:MAG TPA: hypothetical protein DCR69_16140 [Clostridium sp.]|nr:hypothetical protein [Clostridium sp.]